MTGYTAADMVAQLLAGAAIALPWVGAIVGVGVVLFFTFYGVWKGFTFFNHLVSDGYADNPKSSAYDDYKSSGLSMEAYDSVRDGLDKFDSEYSVLPDESDGDRSLWSEAHDDVLSSSDLAGFSDHSDRYEAHFQESFALAQANGMDDDWEAAQWASDRVDDLKLVDSLPDPAYDPWATPKDA